MTWPGWMDVLPALGALLTLLGASLAALWTLTRLLRPIMREAAREACEELYERLKRNDFRHIEEGLKALGDRIGGLEGRMDGLDGRIGGLEGRVGRLEGRMDGLEKAARKDRKAIESRLDRFEARILEAVGASRALGTPEPAAADG